MYSVNPQGHRAIFQGKKNKKHDKTYDNLLATIRQQLKLAFNHFLAITIC